MKARFYFATCQVGAEKAVKAEVLAEHPELRFSFSRPGFVTFKEPSDSGPPLSLERGIFTRLWGEALGQARNPGALSGLLGLVPPESALQSFDRDQYTPGDEPQVFARHGHIRSILRELGIAENRGSPLRGFEVYSLVWVDNFHVFLTRHLHTGRLSAYPGNMPLIPLPESSPSRAYLKIEEAFERFNPSMRAGLEVLEIGCAPGGATSAMLHRGLKVIGVDPQHMDGRVLSMPGFTSIRKAARYLVADDLRGANPEWLVMDASIAPLEALDELSHAVNLLKSLLGGGIALSQGFLTIKLNDWKFASYIPLYLKRIEEIGFHGLHPIQLCGNRQEFFVWASRFG